MTAQTVTSIEPAPPRVSETISQIPEKQTQLLLHEAKQPYEVENARDVPEISDGELLVAIEAIGLNPIDWKSAKSAFQEYAIVNGFNAVKIPGNLNAPHVASVGVAFVAAAVALGICLGLTFTGASHSGTLDFLEIARSQKKEEVPEDAMDEVFDAISDWNRPSKGDWILIHGASSITAQVAIQLAKWSDLKVLAIADVKKHGERLRALGADHIIDRHDPEHAARQIRGDIHVPIRFALDTVGAETAAWCQNVLAARTGVQFRSPEQPSGNEHLENGPSSSLAHLVCLAQAPEEKNPSVRIHNVPIKLFHENEELGAAVSGWLSHLLESQKLKLPETVFEDGGLDIVGPNLDRLKNGEMSGKRLVVRLKQDSS